MSRSPSLAARRALLAPETAEAFLVLLTISHADLPEALRVGSDAVDTISRGMVFTAFPFNLTLPDDVEGQSPEARLTIDNIDRQMVLAVRSLSSAPSIVIEIVRADAPDVIEAQFQDFRLTNVTYDSQVIQGNLSIEDFTMEPFPAAVFAPGNFPGLF